MVQHGARHAPPPHTLSILSQDNGSDTLSMLYATSRKVCGKPPALPPTRFLKFDGAFLGVQRSTMALSHASIIPDPRLTHASPPSDCTSPANAITSLNSISILDTDFIGLDCAFGRHVDPIEAG